MIYIYTVTLQDRPSTCHHGETKQLFFTHHRPSLLCKINPRAKWCDHNIYNLQSNERREGISPSNPAVSPRDDRVTFLILPEYHISNSSTIVIKFHPIQSYNCNLDTTSLSALWQRTRRCHNDNDNAHTKAPSYTTINSCNHFNTADKWWNGMAMCKSWYKTPWSFRKWQQQQHHGMLPISMVIRRDTQQQRNTNDKTEANDNTTTKIHDNLWHDGMLSTRNATTKIKSCQWQRQWNSCGNRQIRQRRNHHETALFLAFVLFFFGGILRR